MLQRAASNAYSWWWASHIRTKQSKWLDNNLQEMEEKVKSMLKLIEEDADSFAKRAEIYFKKRPELINFVEEAYRAYRALAERYDHVSGELHKANHTIATVFPDQVQLAIEGEDDDNSPKAISSIDSSKFHMLSMASPQIGLRNKNRENWPAIKKSQPRRVTSQMNKDKAQEEIDRLQKGILVLQTEKEFIKGSYESGLAKYWDIEKQIVEMQDEVCFLQDEFSATSVIEDHEARSLMVLTALKSCEDTLVSLQQEQKRSAEEARLESERIKDATEKLKALKGEYGQTRMQNGESCDETTGVRSTSAYLEEEVCNLKQERLELQSICRKVKEHSDMNSDRSVVELAEKIDELVNKVIDLELTVSSQTAQITRLRLEIDELQKHLRSLEEDKTTLDDGSNSLSDRLRQAEEELQRIQDLEKCVQDGRNMIQTHFSEACHSLNDLSEILQSPRQHDAVNIACSFQEEENSHVNNELQRECKERDDRKVQDTKDNLVEEKTHGIHGIGHCLKDQEKHLHSEVDSQVDNVSGEFQVPIQEFEVREPDSSQLVESETIQPSTEPLTQTAEQEDGPNWQHLLLNGLEDREKLLLSEYTSILRNFKETKKKLSEAEKKNQEYLFETATQIRELKSAGAKKDEEIRSLRQKLISAKTSSGENANSHLKEVEDLCHLKPGSMSRFMAESSNPQSSEILEDPRLESMAKIDKSVEVADMESPLAEEDIKLYNIDEQITKSAIEEKFRRDIDTLLEENLDFWLRFSTMFHQIQKFQTAFEDLHAEIEKLKGSNSKEGRSTTSAEQAIKPESAPISKRLRDLKTRLQVWVEQNALLRGELQYRISSLRDIKEEISRVAKASLETEEIQFTPYQAARFQGEVLNMQQENNKVADELQLGLDHVRGLQDEVEMALLKLHQNFELSGSKKHHHYHFRHFSSRTRIPLGSFLFGVKPKKPSIFACMNPILQKQYSDLRSGFPT